MRHIRVLYFLSACLLAAATAFGVPAASNYSVQLFSPSSNYTGTFGSIGSGAMQMQEGCGVAINPTNSNIFVADFGNNRIEIWTATGQWIGYFGGPGSGPGQLQKPCGLAFAPNGSLYVADTGNNRVQVFTSLNSAQTSWNAAFSFGGMGTNKGQMSGPFGLAILPGSSSSSFTVYVADTGNNRIQIFSPGGAFLSGFGQQGTGAGQFNEPVGLAFASNGDLLVVDVNNARIERFTAVGIYIGQFGSGQASANPLAPWAVAVCPQSAGAPYAGRIMVTDTANNRVLIYNSSGNYVLQYLLHASSAATMASPLAIAFLSDGRQVVTDEFTNGMPPPPPPTAITIVTVPAGLQFTVDAGGPQTAPMTIDLSQGPHTIAVTSPQGKGGNEYAFEFWSDMGAQSHTITVGASPATYTATFGLICDDSSAPRSCESVAGKQ